MQKKLGSRSTRGPRAPSAETIVADLQARFARFRAESGRGARVPGDLRAAALAALHDGVSQGDLSRACRISWSQVDAWKRRAAGERARSPAKEPGGLRAFSVVDDARPVERRSAGDGPLELRLGPWAVTVRLAPSPEDSCSR